MDYLHRTTSSQARMLQVTTAMNSAVATDGEKLNPKRNLSLPGEECAVSRVSKRQRIRNVKWIESPSVCHDKRKSDDYDHAKIWYSVSDTVELQFMMPLICFVLCTEKSVANSCSLRLFLFFELFTLHRDKSTTIFWRIA